jgi:hypothetical protein
MLFVSFNLSHKKNPFLRLRRGLGIIMQNTLPIFQAIRLLDLAQIL